LFQSGILLPYRPSFLVVSPDGGVHSPLGQFPRFAKMTAIRLSVRCQRKTLVLVIGLARIPLLLFRHRRGVRVDKGKSVEIVVEYVTIQFSCLRLLNDLPRFVETL
jgi:hypothetical protein